MHQVALELPFEQFVEYFEDKELDRVNEIWEEATSIFAHLSGNKNKVD